MIISSLDASSERSTTGVTSIDGLVFKGKLLTLEVGDGRFLPGRLMYFINVR